MEPIPVGIGQEVVQPLDTVYIFVENLFTFGDTHREETFFTVKVAHNHKY